MSTPTDPARTPAPGLRTCPRCGASFTCELEAGGDTCWCMALPPIAPVPASGGCLCPDCLRTDLAARARRRTS